MGPGAGEGEPASEPTAAAGAAAAPGRAKPSARGRYFFSISSRPRCGHGALLCLGGALVGRCSLNGARVLVVYQC
eukprot:7715979-Pyramimonas_sp.AAC.1